MVIFQSANNFHLSRVERSYLAVGAGLGMLFSASGFLVDMQFRYWRGLDAGMAATFSSTAMHLIALSSPFIVGRVFLELGRKRREADERLVQMQQSEKRTREQAHRDVVTGLYNRSYLTMRLEEGIASRVWQSRNVRCYMLDLDKFKHINDTLGHRAGDVVLTKVGARLQALCTGNDIPVRLGGDEFLLLRFPPENEDPSAFAAALIAAIEKPVIFEKRRLSQEVSIGIARVGYDGNTWSDVLRAADLALYRAKGEGGSAYRHYTADMQLARDANSQLVDDMRSAIDRNGFELHYQPIHSTRTGEIGSFETLMRWDHPERGRLSPAEFIPVAESSGLIVRLGEWALLQACRAATGWPASIGVAVNLSPIQFSDENLPNLVRSVIDETGLDPARLDLEITESVLLEPTPRVLANIAQLRAIGAKIVMDDFGTGFSSLNSLRRFRFDKLKIDKSFTDGVDNEEGAAIVRTIVHLASTLKMETVLEGIETEAQAIFARLEGVDEVQGYHYAKPMPLERVTEMVAARHGDISAGCSRVG